MFLITFFYIRIIDMHDEKLGEKLLVDNLEEDNLGEDKLDVECRECPIDLESIKPNTALVIKDEDGSRHFFNEKGLREWLKENNINPLTRANVSLRGDNVNVRYETGEPAYDEGQPIDREGEGMDIPGHNARATDRQDNLEDDGYINYFAPLEAVRDSWWWCMDGTKDHRSWCETLCEPLLLAWIIGVSALHTFAAIGASLVVAANLVGKFISDCLSSVRSNLPSFSFSFFGNNNANNANNANNENNIARIGHRRTGAVMSDNIFNFGPGS
jgi:hypothetical protein